jgi:hypothetical protein
VNSQNFQFIFATKKIFSKEKCTIFAFEAGQNQVRKQVNFSKALKLRERSLQEKNKSEKIRGFCCLFLGVLEMISSTISFISHEK